MLRPAQQTNLANEQKSDGPHAWKARDLKALLRPWQGAIAVWLVIVAVACVALFHLREDALRSQNREIGLISLALVDEIDRGLGGAEEAFTAMRAELHDGRLKAIGVDAPRLLHTRADLMPLVQSLWIFDRQGRLLTSSDASTPPALTTFSPPLEHLQEGVLAIGRPFEDELTHETVVALGVRFLDSPDAPEGGWIVGSLPASAFLGAFTSADLAPDARVAVFRADGARLAAVNFAGPTLDEFTVASRLDSRSSFDGRAFRDGSDDLVSIRQVPRHALKVVVARDLRGVLAGWYGAAQLTGAALLLLLAAVYLVGRANTRRAHAQRDLLAQRSRANRLESLGTLAGGVAHDFNNVLAGVVGFAELAQDATEPGSDQRRHLDNVMQAAMRGKKLVERILAFSAGAAQSSTVFRLEPVVVEVLDLLSAALRPGIVLERAFDSDIGCVRGDPTQAFEAVMNLCNNAIQAMPEGGMVTIRLDRLTLVEPKVLSHSELGPARYLAVRVTDDGPGVTPAVMEHLFEPFYTTRRTQGGTGFGLAVAHGAVAEFSGGIDVRNEPGRGATFTLYFPEATGAPMPIARSGSVGAGAGRAVLLVDDDMALVEMGVEMLRALGYAPTGVGSPLDAIELVRKAPQRFAALITDESMPGMSGTELTAQVRRLAPELPVLVLSGFGGSLLARRAEEAGAALVLAKPLQRQALGAALTKVIG